MSDVLFSPIYANFIFIVPWKFRARRELGEVSCLMLSLQKQLTSPDNTNYNKLVNIHAVSYKTLFFFTFVISVDSQMSISVILRFSHNKGNTLTSV